MPLHAFRRGLVEQTLQHLAAEHVVHRIWSWAPDVWKSDPQHAAVIKNRLGWLDVTKKMDERVDELNAFRDEIAATGFVHVVLLGMGGSSLGVEVLNRTLAENGRWPKLTVLDATSSEAIRAVERDIMVENTLFIVASKSSTTTETLATSAISLRVSPRPRESAPVRTSLRSPIRACRWKRSPSSRASAYRRSAESAPVF